uniref:Fungal lipase-type domain-containing protein n=1 Tax=Oryza barthii TaxID=65489 RepID=A0A0D3G147_9ORYZ
MSKLDYCFSNDYMVLRPDRAGAYELLHLLFSPKVGRNKAVDCFTSTELHSFRRRLSIFLNLLLQLFLLSLVGPLVAVLGGALEFALNLASNVLHGRMEYPDRKSASYRSITGLIDPRVDLERSITPADSRYHAALCVMASKVAYENEAFIRDVVTRRWQMEFVQFFNCWNEFENAYTAQAFVFCDKAADAELVVVAFRGTPALDVARWCADVDPSWYKIPRLGRAHAAYTHALGAQRNIGWPKWVEHVKGKAALDRLAGVYTFGQPRVGDAMLAMFAERNLDRPRKRHFRITYGDDPLPRLPHESSAAHFLHFGIRLHFDSLYNLKVVKELPGDGSSSSSAAEFATSRINAAWELARSAYLGYWRSAYCREGWLLMAARAAAVALPGLPFHRVQDYVNAVTLAGSNIPKDM